MISIETRRRILATVLESIKVENPEYIDDVASSVTKTICNMIERNEKLPDKTEFVRKCIRISTRFFQFNKVDRKEFFIDLYERLKFAELEFHTSSIQEPVEWVNLLEESGLTSEIQQKILLELKTLKKEYNEGFIDIMKSLLGIKTKIAVSGSELQNLQTKLESLVLILKIDEKDKQGFVSRLRKWGSEVGLGVVGNFLYDILKLISAGG